MRCYRWLVVLSIVLLSSAAQAQDRYALGLFHFNVQYVAGGTAGFHLLTDPSQAIDNDAMEDQIIVESFKPVLDVYEKHPSWGVDIEMQGYMLDVIGQRHPDVLTELRSMAKSGQIDVVSFHYSDQLFTAFPAQDWQRSQALTAATFKKWDVPLAKAVFCQEGQAGMAMAPAMKAHGYQNMLWPKNLWSYQHDNFDSTVQPLYRFGDVFLVPAGQGVHFVDGTTDIQTTWTYFDDGEILATGKLGPYFTDSFKFDPAAMADYEQKLLDLETQGYTITTVDKYVAALRQKLTPSDPPPLLDGTWQPNSTAAEFKWLGGNGAWSPFGDERDNTVRTLNALAHRELTAAEAAAKVAGLDARAELDSAWRLLFLGEVSDATGINPIRGEVEYGISHSTEALRIARDVIRQAKTKQKASSVIIDPGAGSMVAGTEKDPMRGQSVAAPIKLDIKPGDRSVTEKWEKIADGHYRVAIHFGPGTYTDVSVVFPGDKTDDFVTTLALDDTTPHTFHRSDFTFKDFYMALPTGLISLGKDRYVIKDEADEHLAAHIRLDTGNIGFEDKTLAKADSVTWVFHVFSGSAAEAVKLADAINVTRRVVR